MTKRVFRSIFLVAFVVLMACLVIIMGVLYDYFTAAQSDQLKAQTNFVAQGVSNEGLDYFEGLKTGGYRITWISGDGTVIFDSSIDAETMENHADREEVQSALQTGYGESSRLSATLTERMLYSAQVISDGTVVRVSSTQYSVLTFVLLMLQPMAIVIVVAIILSALLASRLAKHIVRPLNDLNLDDPLSNDAYEEISPLLTRIERQHRQVKTQMAALQRKRDEFAAVTGSMNEGLVLLNDNGIILSINKSAIRLFGTDKSCEGQDMLTVNRSIAMQELLRKAMSGEHDEMVMEISGGQYQIAASPVISGGQVGGVVLLTFDITEKTRTEQMRREFTANVSHELKTPLHSISGCAEIMQNGLVRQTDMQKFIGQIYSEAQRLIALVDDIIRLSHLDEGANELPREEIDLFECAKDTAERLTSYAQEKNVTLTVKGENTIMFGVPQLISEIIYNLCDNAIKYNRENGRVDVTVSTMENEVVLTVVDTGIGIPEEHASRIFERFYRVDKSHSKESGGTGLGLSIVKHAAQIHGAKIKVESQEGVGTEITLRFPK